MFVWERIRRNHGLEHATITLLLADAALKGSVAGNAMPAGFFVYGSIDTAALERAAHSALSRMGSGEPELAVSPFCGTNIVVAAAMAATAALATTRLSGSGVRSWSRVFSNVVWALVLARPVGRVIQEKLTTSGDVARMRITGIKRWQIGKLTIHRVSTAIAA